MLISIGVVKSAIGYARGNSKSTWRWGCGAALLMYLIPFWDWIPTAAMHQYYCATEAGFWTYKTPEQWKKENLGVMDGLIDNSPHLDYPNWPEEDWRGKKITSVNQRIGYLLTDHLRTPGDSELPVNVWRWHTELLDKATGEVLARHIDFSTGNNGYIGGMHSMKFWLYNEGCPGRAERRKAYGELLSQFRGKRT